MMPGERLVNRDECPVGCGRTHAAGQLMCPGCWSKVPVDLRREVCATWRRWRRDFGDLDLFRAYTDARARAIGAVA